MEFDMGLTQPTARAFSLEIDELAALCVFLNAKKLVGLDESLFRVSSEENLPQNVAKLSAHGWIRPAERQDTWHFNEDLMQALAVAVAPQVAVLARSEARKKSIVFYCADDAISEIVVTDERAVVASLTGVEEMASHVINFLQNALPAELAVARVKGEGFDAGRRAQIDASGQLRAKTPGLLPAETNAFHAQNVATFLRNAMADLRAAASS
jgi:hypothetical protein